MKSCTKLYFTAATPHVEVVEPALKESAERNVQEIETFKKPILEPDVQGTVVSDNEENVKQSDLILAHEQLIQVISDLDLPVSPTSDRTKPVSRTGKEIHRALHISDGELYYIL